MAHRNTIDRSDNLSADGAPSANDVAKRHAPTRGTVQWTCPTSLDRPHDLCKSSGSSMMRPPAATAAARRYSACSRATETSTCIACRKGLAGSRSCIQNMRDRFGQPGRLNHRLDVADRRRSAVQYDPVRTTLCGEEVAPSLLAHVHLRGEATAQYRVVRRGVDVFAGGGQCSGVSRCGPVNRAFTSAPGLTMAAMVAAARGWSVPSSGSSRPPPRCEPSRRRRRLHRPPIRQSPGPLYPGPLHDPAEGVVDGNRLGVIHAGHRALPDQGRSAGGWREPVAMSLPDWPDQPRSS
jgi:hypothetical protein